MEAHVDVRAIRRARRVSGGARARWLATGAAIAALTAACTGEIGDPGHAGSGSGTGAGSGSSGTASSGTGPGSTGPGGTGTGPGSTGDPVTGQPCKPGASFASARLTLLSDEQYVNVVRDVFGVTFDGDVSTGQSTSGEYGIDETAAVSTLAFAQAYMRAADQVATKVKPCGTAAVTAACMEQFLRSKLPLAWRRPVTDTEVRGLIDGIFTPAMVDGAPRAVQLTMEAALASPAFLYRAELGANAAGAGSVTLSPYELASAVSFALLNSSPDTELWAKAQDGTIAQQAVLTAQVDRLMTLPAARENLKKKVSYYLNFEKVPFITKDTTVFKVYTPSLQTSLYQSAQRFLDDILWNGRFADLFTSSRIYANAEIGTVYGLTGVTGTQLVAVDGKAAGYSAGLLTQPALLLSANKHAGTDDIVHRGLWVYDNLACGVTVGAPPPDADAVFATITGTERERATKRDGMPNCGTCHKRFDPFGLVTQSFDPIGRFRTIDPETKGAVDTTASISQLGTDLDGDVKNVNDVAAKLAMGRRASDCAVVFISRYTLDHNPDVENSCQIQEVKNNFAASGSFRDLFRAIVTSPAFLTRDL